MRMTIDWQPCQRDPRRYPYSYTRFCVWRSRKNRFKPDDSVVWTDHLSWQYPEYDKLYKEILGTGQCYSRKKPEDIEAFLCKLLEDDVVLTGIEEECNASTGYPYWLLYFRKRKITNPPYTPSCVP